MIQFSRKRKTLIFLKDFFSLKRNLILQIFVSKYFEEHYIHRLKMILKRGKNLFKNDYFKKQQKENLESFFFDSGITVLREYFLDPPSRPPLQKYRVCHGFRLTKQDYYVAVTFDHY